MRLLIKSNPSSTLLAVTFTSLASAMLSAASSLVSVRVSARESNSDTEAVVDSKELLDNPAGLDVVEPSVGDTDGEVLLTPGELLVSENVDPKLNMVDLVDDSSVMVVENTLVVPTDEVVIVKPVVLLVVDSSVDPDVEDPLVLVDPRPSVLVDPNESVDLVDPSLVDSSALVESDVEYWPVVVDSKVVLMVDSSTLVDSSILDDPVVVDTSVVVVPVDPDEDPPFVVDSTIMVDPEVVIVPDISVDSDEDPPVGCFK